MADEAKPHSFVERWPIACALFDLESLAPVETSSPEYRTPVKFIKRYPDQVRLLEDEKGVTLQRIVLEIGFEMWMEMLITTMIGRMTLDQQALSRNTI